MQTVLRRLLVGLIFVIVLLFVAGQLLAEGRVEVSDDPEPLRIIYPRTISSIPVLELLERYPDDYTGSFYTDHPQALAQVLAGEADILATGYSFGYSRFVSGGDILYVMTPVWGVSAIMTAAEIDELADLAGESIYAPFEGSPIDVFLRELLAAEGLSGEISIRYAPFPQSAALLGQGETAASVLVEPIASTLELGGRAYRYENLQDAWARISGGEPRSPQVSVFAAEAIGQDRPDSLALLRERLREETRRVVDNLGSTATKYAAVLEFPEPVVQNALENSLFDAPDAETERGILELYASIVGDPALGDDFYVEALR